MKYIFKRGKSEMEVDATPRGLFAWWTLKRFFIGMKIAGWTWERKS